MVGVYIFLMGGFFGGLLAGAFSDAWGQRTALTIIVPPAALLGGLLVMYGAQFMKGDISLGVQELLEEQEERKRMAADPEHIPVLQVRNLDAGYGPLQVLFDVDFEVQRGEVARPARHQRRRQVDPAEDHRRADHARPRRRPVERSHDHARVAPELRVAAGHGAGARRGGDLPDA